MILNYVYDAVYMSKVCFDTMYNKQALLMANCAVQVAYKKVLNHFIKYG